VAQAAAAFGMKPDEAALGSKMTLIVLPQQGHNM
jgi:hypothetical protein